MNETVFRVRNSKKSTRCKVVLGNFNLILLLRSRAPRPAGELATSLFVAGCQRFRSFRWYGIGRFDLTW